MSIIYCDFGVRTIKETARGQIIITVQACKVCYGCVKKNTSRIVRFVEQKKKESNPRKMATPLRKCEVTTKMD